MIKLGSDIKGLNYGGNISKALIDSKLVWSQPYKSITFKTVRMTSPYSNKLYLPKNIGEKLKKLSIKEIEFVGIGKGKIDKVIEVTEESISFNKNFLQITGFDDWLPIGTEVKVYYN